MKRTKDIYILISLNLFLLLIAVIPFAFIGDYFESHLKRNQQIKDSGSLIPGHGGIWDRLDSHMAIIPVFAAIILYEDVFTYLKVIAFFLALVGIYLSSTRAGKLGFDRKYLWLIIIIFFGQGISDAIFNVFLF